MIRHHLTTILVSQVIQVVVSYSNRSRGGTLSLRINVIDRRSSTTEKTDQLTEVSVEHPPASLQDRQSDHRSGSSFTCEREEQHKTHAEQLNNYDQRELVDDHQHDMRNGIGVVTSEINH